jgi:hypothetical protein
VFPVRYGLNVCSVWFSKQTATVFASYWFVACLLFDSNYTDVYIPLKHRFTFATIHGIISYKTELFELGTECRK